MLQCSKCFICSKRMLQAFWSGCCICFTHVLQQYVPNVSFISVFRCSKCFHVTSVLSRCCIYFHIYQYIPMCWREICLQYYLCLSFDQIYRENYKHLWQITTNCENMLHDESNNILSHISNREKSTYTNFDQQIIHIIYKFRIWNLYQRIWLKVFLRLYWFFSMIIYSKRK